MVTPGFSHTDSLSYEGTDATMVRRIDPYHCFNRGAGELFPALSPSPRLNGLPGVARPYTNDSGVARHHGQQPGIVPFVVVLVRRYDERAPPHRRQVPNETQWPVYPCIAF